MSGVMGAKVPEGEAERTHSDGLGVLYELSRLAQLEIPAPPPTRGPWSWSHRRCADGMHRTQVYDAHGETIATFAWFPYPHPEPELDGIVGTSRAANAQLCATAPEMLEALENLENNDGSIPDHAWQMVQAAIAKARGQS